MKLAIGLYWMPVFLVVAARELTTNVDDIEHFVMIKINESDVFPCVVSTAELTTPRKIVKKRKENEEMKEMARKGPSMCSKCVVCAAMVFDLMKEFSLKNVSRVGEDELDVVCTRKLPLHKIWDVSGIRYLGEPTVNARQVIRHEPLAPSIQHVCRKMKNMTSGHELYSLWRQDASKFMTRLCFDPYHHPGLSSCRGLLKKTRGLHREIRCRSPRLARFLDSIAFWRRSPVVGSCDEKEFRVLIAWYTLSQHDITENV